MRKLLVTLTLATLLAFATALPWKAEAAPVNGAQSLAAAAATATSVQSVACNGRPGRCGRGRFWNGYRCVWC